MSCSELLGLGIAWLRSEGWCLVPFSREGTCWREAVPLIANKMSFVLNEQPVFCPHLGAFSCFLGMERPEVQWGWEHPLLAPLPITSFQGTWKPGLWFSLGELMGTEVLGASGIRKGGRWRGQRCHLDKNDEQALLDSCRKRVFFSSPLAFSHLRAPLPSIALHLPPSQWLRKENSGTGSHFILG